MATQAEINQLLGTWVANYFAIDIRGAEKISIRQLDTWFSTYIRPLSVQPGIKTINILSQSQWDSRNRISTRITRYTGTYLDYLKTELQSIAPQLESSLATIGVKNYITIVQEYRRLVSRIRPVTK